MSLDLMAGMVSLDQDIARLRQGRSIVSGWSRRATIGRTRSGSWMMGAVVILAMIGVGPVHAAPREFICQGTTTARSMTDEKSHPFNADFIFDQVAQSWVRIDSRTGASLPMCDAADCTVTFSPAKVVARTGTLVATFDWQQKTFVAADLKDIDETMAEIVTRARCRPATSTHSGTTEKTTRSGAR
ncbi:hypothetical protein [Komagataeibacter europaeus]|uniref:hypothetical protein n=1 Tax=Komagataeibacter europaeus TaxID=33995 RepID=UPI0015F8D293|nr:hypothetical protein [Komagataeibacter europaeus]